MQVDPDGNVTVKGGITANQFYSTGGLTLGGAANFTKSITVNSGNANLTNGLVNVTYNSNTVTIGSQNTSCCHFINSASIPFYFNRYILAVGGFYPYNSHISYRDDGIYYDSVKMIGFGNDGRSKGPYYMFSDPTYARLYTYSANLYITPSGVFGSTSGSSERWKNSISDIMNQELDPKRLYDVKIRQFKYNNDYISDTDERYDRFVPGFIAEELDEVYPIAVAHETHEDGTVTLVS